MPRPPRLDLPGQPQHLIVRGNNRSPLFFSDRDRHLFLRYLAEGLESSASSMHAFVLMPNHVHLLATGFSAGSLSRLIQSVGRRYACNVNRAYSRTGTLFEGRFRSSLVDSRALAYQALFCRSVDIDDLELIRVAAAKGSVVGSTGFERNLESLLHRTVGLVRPGRRSKAEATGGKVI